MTPVGPEHERARPPAGAGFSEAVTFAFGDEAGGLHGLARLGLSVGAGGERQGSALAVLFTGAEPLVALAEGAIALPAGADWDAVEIAGLATRMRAPLDSWELSLGAEAAGVALTFAALGPPAVVDGEEPAAQAGGLEGYEQLCEVTGTARLGGREHTVRCLGQRGHRWGAPDWGSVEATRTLSAWLADGSGLTLTAVRHAGASGHDEEVVWAAVLGAEAPVRVADPRLSTTWDPAGRQRRAGLELWVDAEDDHPRRAAGTAVSGASLDLGQLRLEAAVFAWHMEGRTGVGRYDVLRRA